jgi:hypothetical protein
MKTVSLFAVLFVLASARVAEADELYNNLSAPSINGANTISTSFLNGSNIPQPLAASFSTGASAFNFNSLTVALSGQAPTIGDVFLLGDASNSPGAVLGGFTEDIPLGPTVSDITFGTPANPFPSFTLTPNTRYWIELSISTSASWAFTTDTSGTGVAGEFSAYRPVSSLPWIVSPNTVGPLQMQVAGTTATPEPSSFLLLASALSGLAAFRRRKKIA